jgi:acyl carrier protein
VLIPLDAVCRTVGTVLGVSAPAADDRLVEDLGAESMDLLNVVLTIEREFGVTLDESALAGVSTVRDLHRAVLARPHAAATDGSNARRPD